MANQNIAQNFITLNVPQIEAKSNIVEYFNGKTVFLTGATGFLGKLILEKILRTCKTVKNVQILVRPKKGVAINERIEILFQGPAMDRLKKENPKFRKQVTLVAGDLLMPYLGMSDESIRIFKDEVNIVIHCGASVRFDQKIRQATYANVRSVKHLIEMSKETKNIESFLYISTAFSHCPRTCIKEEFYDPPIKPEALMQLVDILDEDKLEKITPILLSKWPNTYSFTKAVAESLLHHEGGVLPVAIVRPSIIISAVKEPVPGWIDSIYGPTGLFLLASLGIVRSMHGDRNQKCDLIPVDFVVNCIIAATFQRAKLRETTEIHGTIYSSEELTPIYNYCYSPNLPPLTWDKFLKSMYDVGYESFATTKILWFPGGSMKKSKYLHKFAVFFNMIPAHLADLYFKLTGKEQMAVKMLRRVFAAIDMIGYFALRNWKFNISNTQKLFKSLNSEDQQLFEFDMDKFDMKTYVSDYLKGMRVYLLKDPMETLRAGQWHGQKLRILYFAYWGFIYAFFLYFLKRSFGHKIATLKLKILMKLLH